MGEVLTSKDNEVGQNIIKRYDRLETDSNQFRTHWYEIAEYVIPNKNDIWNRSTKVRGEKKTNHLFDTTAINANEELASNLHSILTNPASLFFGLTSGDRIVDSDDAAQEWIQKSVETILNTLNYSNFHTELYETYIDEGAFGTSLLRVSEDDETDVHFEARPIYGAVCAENKRGEIDTVGYKYDRTVKQIIEEYGNKILKKCPELKEMFQVNPEERLEVIHWIEPANDILPYLKKIARKPFVSYHILCLSGYVLRKEGFFENPYVVTRFSKVSGETYGRSPAMKCLPDIKMANKMKKANIEAAQLQVRPPVQAPDEGVLLPLRLNPGGVNFYRSGTKDRIEPINMGANVQIGEQLLEEVKRNIREAFLIDALKIREADRMSATESMLRKDETLRPFAPIMSRQLYEKIAPIIERVFNILVRRGKILPPPEILRNVRLQPFFTSQVALAQKTAQIETIGKVLAVVAPFGQIDPSIYDNYDTDAIARYVSTELALPHELLRNSKDLNKLRQERSEAQESQMQVENSKVESETMKNLATAESMGGQ